MLRKVKIADDAAWLASIGERVAEKRAVKFGCSQTVMALGMERAGLDDPNLLRAMEGYCAGGCSGVCGALCGGAAFLGLLMGKGTAEEPRSAELKALVKDLTCAFRERWGSTLCEELIQGDMTRHDALCPQFMAWTLRAAWERLPD